MVVIDRALWFALCVFSVWLCRKRRNKKQQKMQEMYSGKSIMPDVGGGYRRDYLVGPVYVCVWLCRKRRNKKQQKMQEMYSGMYYFIILL